MGTTESKQLVEDAFNAWAKGEGSVFDLLADDATWTITGSSSLAKTFTSKQQFLDEALVPIAARLSEMIKPTVEQIVAEGDTVVVAWSGHAVATDGKPYDNHYCWIMQVDGQKITKVIAWFDTPTLTDLFNRVNP